MADVLRFVLRLPRDLHQALQEIARREKRSLHGQIMYVLERFVTEDREREAEAKIAA